MKTKVFELALKKKKKSLDEGDEKDDQGLTKRRAVKDQVNEMREKEDGSKQKVFMVDETMGKNGKGVRKERAIGQMRDERQKKVFERSEKRRRRR